MSACVTAVINTQTACVCSSWTNADKKSVCKFSVALTAPPSCAASELKELSISLAACDVLRADNNVVEPGAAAAAAGSAAGTADGNGGGDSEQQTITLCSQRSVQSYTVYSWNMINFIALTHALIFLIER